MAERSDPRCTHGYGWSVLSVVTGGHWGHWRTKEDALRDDALGQFLAKFNHHGSLVCHNDWWPEELDDKCAHDFRYDHHRAGILCDKCDEFHSDFA